MDEREFFEERTEQKKHTMVCPHCNQPGEYELNWLVRRKRAQLPRAADEMDRARFAKAQSYMVRRDDMLGCKNVRCRKRFEITGLQSVADLQAAPTGTAEDRAARIRAAFGPKNRD
jgi:hypothetical protein